MNSGRPRRRRDLARLLPVGRPGVAQDSQDGATSKPWAVDSGGNLGSSDGWGRRSGAGPRLALLLAAVAALLAATTIANILWPVILRDRPLLLPALDGRNRYLLLASAKVEVVPLIAVGVGRRLVGHIVYYLLGRWYGETALRWATRHSRIWQRIVTRHQRFLARVAEAAVLISSSNIARTLAGATGMSTARFVVLEIVGTTAQMAALLVFIRSTEEQVPKAVGLLDGHASWLTVLLVSLGLGWLAWRVAKRRRRRLQPPAPGSEDAGAGERRV